MKRCIHVEHKSQQHGNERPRKLPQGRRTRPRLFPSLVHLLPHGIRPPPTAIRTGGRRCSQAKCLQRFPNQWFKAACRETEDGEGQGMDDSRQLNTTRHLPIRTSDNDGLLSCCWATVRTQQPPDARDTIRGRPSRTTNSNVYYRELCGLHTAVCCAAFRAKAVYLNRQASRSATHHARRAIRSNLMKLQL